jgi:polyferredoxin
LSIFLGRFFCGWLCPFGLYMDVITIVRKALKVRYVNLSSRLNKFLHNFRYVLFAAFLVIALVLAFLETESSLEVLTIKLQLFAGPFEHLGILLSPLNPLIVPWEGPVEISGLFFSFPYAQDIIKYAGENLAPIMVLAILGSVLAASVFIRRFWCRFCPTGISIAAINKLRGFKWMPLLHLEKDETKCTKCGICKRVCPVQVEEVYEQKGGVIGTSMCMLCARCVEMCPYEDCLKLNFGGKTVLKSRNWLEPSDLE